MDLSKPPSSLHPWSLHPNPLGRLSTARKEVSVLAPSSDALCSVRSVLVTTSKALVTRSDALVPSSEHRF